jgi:ATP-dependent Clp protease adaptor protein ClpS
MSLRPYKHHGLLVRSPVKTKLVAGERRACRDHPKAMLGVLKAGDHPIDHGVGASAGLSAKVLLLNDDYTPNWSACSIRTATRIMLEIHDKGTGACGIYRCREFK